MPDLASRFDHEKSIALSLHPHLVDAAQQAVKNPDLIDWVKLEQEAEKKLYAELLLVYLLAVGGMSQYTGDLQPSEEVSKKMADSYASKRSRDVAAGMASKLRDKVKAAQIDAARSLSTGTATLDDVKTEFNNRIRDIFNDTLPEVIAATEVTGAISNAETDVARDVNERNPNAGNRANPPNVGTGGNYPKGRLVSFWVTEHDGLVCKICRPLNGQRESVWVHIFQSGPPAHPNCRCRLRWDVV
jgi:hypothetical protein